jgi:hypothetical protein
MAWRSISAIPLATMRWNLIVYLYAFIQSGYFRIEFDRGNSQGKLELALLKRLPCPGVFAD